jgi:hypothetical protein
MRIRYSCQGTEKDLDTEKREIVIGRDKAGVAVDLDLSSDRSISRPHARIWVDDTGQYWIEDLGSKHGTLVSMINIKGKGRVELAPGVAVQIGNTKLRLMEERKDESFTLPQLRVVVNCLPTVNYSLYHAGVPFLSDLIVFNDSETTQNEIEFQLALPGFAQFHPITIPTVPVKGSYTVNPLPELWFNLEKLRDLPAPEMFPLEAGASRKQLRLMPPVQINVLPPNAWHCVGHEAALTGFVMPHSKAVEEVISRAHFALRRMLRGARGFADASESSDPRAFEKTIKAVYFCLQERYGITYEYEPRTYDPEWQMVRFHHEVLEKLKGTCIDLALLFAACLENIHLDPLIILVQTGAELQHALVGCWRHGTPRRPDGTPELVPVIKDAVALRQWVDSDSGELIVLDSKGFSETEESPAGMSFIECREKGIDYIKNCPLVYALDIVAAREAGITPMPFGQGVQFDRPAGLAIYRARREAERFQSSALGARHLLLGLLSLETGLMHQILARIGKEGVADTIVQKARESMERTSTSRCCLPETEHWQAIMRRAKEIAQSGSASLVTEADLAKALLETPSAIDKVLGYSGLTQQQCLEELDPLLQQGVIGSVWVSTGSIG